MISFTIPGVPVGKGRPRFAKRGNFVKIYTDDKTASYENLVKLAASNAMQGRPPIECACRVELFIFVTPPESWSNKKKIAAMSGELKPIAGRGYDIDNYAKSIFDGCNGIIWADDKQVTTAVIQKRYAAKAEALIVIGKDE